MAPRNLLGDSARVGAGYYEVRGAFCRLWHICTKPIGNCKLSMTPVRDYLNSVRVVEIKTGQVAKPGNWRPHSRREGQH
ncbi:MAG: hypothetical protein ACUVRS_08985 [Armatimonadota bacterium]